MRRGRTNMDFFSFQAAHDSWANDSPGTFRAAAPEWADEPSSPRVVQAASTGSAGAAVDTPVDPPANFSGAAAYLSGFVRVVASSSCPNRLTTNTSKALPAPAPPARPPPTAPREQPHPPKSSHAPRKAGPPISKAAEPPAPRKAGPPILANVPAPKVGPQLAYCWSSDLAIL